jgi:hypothetical protein
MRAPPADYHTGRHVRPPQQGGDAHNIERSDLRGFVFENLELIDFHKVDKRAAERTGRRKGQALKRRSFQVSGSGAKTKPTCTEKVQNSGQ